MATGTYLLSDDLGSIRESSLGGLVLWVALHISGTVHHVLTGSTWTRERGVALELWRF